VNLFVNTSAFDAVMDADDQYHGTAKTVWSDLLHGAHRPVAAI
jgi:predicted nucleic acid-binding protein